MRPLQIILVSTIFTGLAFSTTRAAIDIPAKVVNGEIGRKLDEYCTRLAGIGFNGSVLVAQHGKILYHNAFGIANVPTGTPIYTGTAMSTGSVSKQFTAAGILALEADGELSVTDSLPRFFDNVPEDKRSITIHELLTHTSGLPGETGPDEDPIARDDFVRDLLARPLIHEPGSAYEYSNAGYSLAAAIIEKVSGKTYEQYLRDRLFTPAGMTSTGLYLLRLPDSLIGHSQNPNLNYVSMADRPADAWHLTGSGGLLSTPADMYRWHLALENNTVLPKTETDKMFTPYVREYPDRPTFYGYGWVVQHSQRRNATVIWHNGGAMPHGWGCAVYYYVEDDAVFIVFSNKPIDGRNPVDAIAIGMSQVVFGEPYDLPPVWAEAASELMRKYAGTYIVDDSTSFIIALTDSALTISARGQEAFDRLYPSPLPEPLSKYNALTVDLITEMSRGEFRKAATRWDEGPTEKMIGMNEQFWHSFDTLGDFVKAETFGTYFRGDIATACHLTFTQGGVDLLVFWMRGKCVGITEQSPPAKEIKPLAANRFAGFTLGLGTVPVVTFTDSTITIDNGHEIVTARRM